MLIGVGVAGLIIVAWLVAPSLQRWASSSVSVPRDRLRLAVVVRTDLVRDVSVQGRVVAAVSPSLFAPSGGTITLLVEAGATVAEGQTLALLDSPELQNQLQREQAMAQTAPAACWQRFRFAARHWLRSRRSQRRWPRPG